MEAILEKIRKIPDFPKEGILFYDITTALKDPVTFNQILESMTEPFERKKIEIVVGMESRGFILGGAIANELGAGFVPTRKPGKLPAETISQEYELEYGKDSFQMHKDAIQPGQKVLMVDDLLATGGTALATMQMIHELGGEIVGAAFAIELKELNGRKRLEGLDVHSLLKV